MKHKEDRSKCRVVEFDALTPAVSEITDADFITLERGACFGRCPVYSVTVKGDGRVTAMGQQHVTQEGPLEWTIDRQVAKRLLAEFVRVDAFSKKATMIGRVTDLPTAKLQGTIGSRKVAIDHYGAGSEIQMGFGGKDNPLLTRLEELVESLSEAETRVVGCATEQ